MLLGLSSALGQTTKGTEFWFSYIYNLVQADPQVYISAETNVTGVVEIPGIGFTANFAVNAGTTQPVTLPANAIVPYSEGLHQLAVRVEACDSVTVYAVFPASFSSDATVVFPKNSLGSEYRVLNMTGSPNDWGDAAQIVATEDNTVIEITPSVNTGGGRPAGVPFTVTLNRGDVYQLTHPPTNADLTGTRIVGMNVGECKPFGVFSGSQCINIGNCTACDQIYDMLIPNSNLGHNYGLVPLAEKGQTIYRVMAIENGTQVSVDGNVVATLNAGQFHQFQNNTFSYLSSTAPVMVSQFARGVSCDNTGDPFKVSIFPIEQSINRITFNALQTPVVNNFWVNIVSPTAEVGTVTLDGANIGAQFTPFPFNAQYSYARINIPVGDHTLDSRAGILATVYGWGGAESFGYCAGASMKDLTNDFSIATTPACAGETVTFTAVTDPATIDYIWDFGDGTPPQNGVAITHAYAQNGAYTVTLTKVKNNQCDINITKPMDVIDPPISIRQNDTTLCLGQFIDLIVPVNEPFEVPRVNGCGDTISVEIIVEYDSIYWSTGAVGDSIRLFPTTDTVIYVFGEKFDSDCIARDSIIIRVVDIAADLTTTNVCLLDEVCIQDLSTSTSVLSVTSFFINDSLVGQGDPDACFLYHTAGLHEVKVVVNDPSGCADSAAMPLTIYTHPIADFSLANACETDSVIFTSAADGNGYQIADFLWDFTSNGIIDQEGSETGHVYTDAGTFEVRHITINEYSCADTLIDTIIIHPMPQVDFDALSVCLNDTTRFSDLSSIITGSIVQWDWDFGDAGISSEQSPTHLYGAPGAFNVILTLTSDQNCIRASADTVHVWPLPEADFTFEEVCATFPAAFNNTSSGSTDHEWDFGDNGTSVQNSPNHTYTLHGQYDVQLIAISQNGCRDTIVQEVTSHPLPIAGFTNDTVCAMLPTSFTDTSAVDTGAVVAWFWDFGDGESSALQNPTHVYLTGGNYLVQLIVTTDEGCQDSITRSVVVHPKPMADFTFTDECLGFATQLNDASTVAAGSQVVLFSWEMGDNVGTSAAEDTAYIFDDSGIYTITLEVETDLGCRDTVSHDAEVFVLPVAAFTVDDVCGYDEAVFVNQSTIPSGSIDNNLWNLDDGTVMDTITPAPHLYATHGTYDIRLITISDNGCRDTADAELVIFPVPTALFTFDTVCFPEMTSFTDLSTVPGNGTIETWFWRFGDQNTNNTDQNPQHGYAQWGDYEVTLTVTTADGCVDDTIIAPARVHPKPLAAFSPSIANCHEDTTFFEDLSTLDNFPLDSLVLWQWQFGDGASSPLPSPTHLYGDEGFYDATLTVTSNHGCTDSVTHSVEIYPLPRVMFSVSEQEGCQPFTVQFYDESNIPVPYQLRSWAWDLGDSTGVVTTQFPTHTYLNDSLGPFDLGIYTVTLTVTSMNGCVSSHTFEDYITEHPKPTAHFDVDPKREELLFARMRVTDLSSPNVTTWLYDMGDWTTYDIQHPIHNYADTGDFVITQFVTTDFGCRDTAEFMVRVDPEFYFYIPNTFTPNNDGVNDTFFGTGVGVVDYQMVIFDRWGAQVFESGSMDLHWDGTKNGRQVQIGVYTYMISVVDIKGAPHQYVGNVNLVR